VNDQHIKNVNIKKACEISFNPTCKSRVDTIYTSNHTLC